MPLRVIAGLDQDILAWTLSPAEWSALRAENAARKHLRMPCCDAKVVLRTSNLGTQHFAHARRGPCATAPETAEHLLSKMHAALGAQDAGWQVATEVRGCTPAGEEWIADVLATRGNVRIAFEIQWSSQTEEETKRRQQRYTESGVRCMWLMKSEGRLGHTPDLPALRLMLDGGIPQVLAKNGSFAPHRKRQTPEMNLDFPIEAAWIPLREFVRAALTKRYRYAPLLGVTVPCELRAYPPLPCESCGKPLRTINRLVVENSRALQGMKDSYLSLPISSASWLQQQFEQALGKGLMHRLQLGVIKERSLRNSPKPVHKQCCSYCGWYVNDDDRRLWDLEHEAVAAFPIHYPDTIEGLHLESRLSYGLSRWWFTDEIERMPR